ncbi:MAG: type II toxin-antitoxin system VapC family toxin [Flammeovirgaceae bacterium]|nr:MAG: type II toxin-antitoxin system VapC family toxin [Flammeovirgaceae bacterium]
MNYLLDTHIFLWALISPAKLSERCKEILMHYEEVYISPIVFWEISLKYALGKITLKGVKPEDLLSKTNDLKLKTLDFKSEDALSFYKLPKHHTDPFDRMLVWQAIRNNLALISHNSQLQHYESEGLKLIW